jgi:excisionase family DNA binding protein
MAIPALPNPPPGLPVYLTISESAAWLRVCRRTVERWIYEGKLRPKRIGKKRLLDASDLAALMDASAEGPTSAA